MAHLAMGFGWIQQPHPRHGQESGCWQAGAFSRAQADFLGVIGQGHWPMRARTAIDGDVSVRVDGPERGSLRSEMPSPHQTDFTVCPSRCMPRGGGTFRSWSNTETESVKRKNGKEDK
jgi:hypothetical protein